jgi:hypothetical protein
MVAAPDVAVAPAAAFRGRRRLFAALGEALGVTLREGAPGGKAPDAVVHIGESDAPSTDVSTYWAGVPVLEPRMIPVTLADDRAIAAPLRGRTIPDRDAQRGEPLVPRADEVVLASTPGGPSWTVSTTQALSTVRVTVAPDELDPRERLCDRLTSGRFAALLPLVEFLRSVSAGSRFSAPPLRAAFVIDDPNLHASSYGYLRYDETQKAARKHGFHVAFATVPLDSWLARRSAAAWFKGSELSLLVHGNDHIRRELEHDSTADRAVARLAQAQRRIDRLEQRSGVGVSRVMAPPHGACSRLMTATLPRVGFEALCISRPYAWLDEPPPDEPLVGWRPADVVEGLTVLPRRHLSSPREDLPLLAYLGRPVILYGHHTDVADGLDGMVAAADDVNRLGDVAWLPLHSIARSSFETRCDESQLDIRMSTRRAVVSTPSAVDRLTVNASVVGDVLVESDAGSALGRGPHDVEEGQELTISVLHDAPVDPLTVASPPRRLWPLARRLLVEARDRGQPAARRIRSIRT